MFKYCLWLLIDDTHVIEKNKKIARLLNTSSFIPHVTIHHSLETPISYHHLKRPREILIVGEPYCSMAPIIDNNDINHIFYSIEQRVFFPEAPKVKAHISLAYRVDEEPFEIQDLFQITARSLDLKNTRVKKRKLKIRLANCFDTNPTKWYIIN